MASKFYIIFIVFTFIMRPFTSNADDKMLSDLENRLKNNPSLSDFIDYAYQTNPMIKANKSAWRETLERYRIISAYPDPQLSVTYWPESVANNLNSKKTELMISQTIPFPGKLKAAGEASKAEARFNRINLDKTVRDIIIGIRESYNELSYIREALRLSIKNQELLTQLKTLSETGYAKNKAALIDVMKAQSQAAQSGYDRLLLEELEKTETTKLNALLNRDKYAVIGNFTNESYQTVVYSLEEIFSLSEKNRDEIKMAKADIEKTEAEAKKAQYENYPEFMFGFIYESDAPKEPEGSRENMYGIQLGLTLPIWIDKNQGRTAASKAAVDKSKAMAVSQVNDTRAMVQENYFRLQNAKRLIELYQNQLIPQTQKSMDIADSWNRQGIGSFTDYIETQSVWYNFQLALFRAKADYGKYLARLEGLVGHSLTVK